MTDRQLRGFAASFGAVLLLAALLRGLFPTADPPWRATVGVVWHDEGAWTHNARNKALWGTWQTDNWNPLYIAPVFTGLEYASFATFGVGLWQARLVSQVAGVAAVLLLGLGVARVAGQPAGLAAAALLATNFVAVMYDRAAIMESSMTAFCVASWWAFTRAQDQPRWGLAAGGAAVLALFTKAAAIFFVGALGLAALASIALDPGGQLRRGPVGLAWINPRARDATDRQRAAAVLTLMGLAAAGLVALLVFVAPAWADYRFYNWQMSVTRKPSYDLRSLIDRLSWFPVLHDVLTRMWLVAGVGLLGWLAHIIGFRTMEPARRVLTLWLGLGVFELLLHDVGNERRFVVLIPALVALAAVVLCGDRTLLPGVRSEWRDAPRRSRTRWLLLIPASYVAYVMAGSAVRLAFLYEVRPAVRLAAVVAVVALVGISLFWRRLEPWVRAPWSPRAAALAVMVTAAGGVAQYAQWVGGRTYLNIEASRELGRVLPAGTLVHGKLANGLALENRIRPIFVGREFGNYADRLTRNDVPFVLTYVSPRAGYEGPVILDVLEAYPERRILFTFPVAETAGGRDRAALIRKGPPAIAGPPLRAVRSDMPGHP